MTLCYRLGAEIGRGGMGEVFRAQLDDGRAVAVKRIRAGRASDPHHIERLVAEAATTAALVHPNIVRLHGAERDQDGQVSLVMELVEGVDLARLVRASHLPLNAAVYVVAALLRALDHAHEHGGIVHRDVSPHNVLLSWDGEVKLSDFGLARAIGRGPTTGGLVRGKLHYLSPEQLQRAPLDGRADLFAVGVVLYELLTGRLPQSGTQGEIMAQVLNNEPLVPPHALQPELPAELGQVTMRLLERDRARRYQSAREALAALPDVGLGRAELVALLRTLRDTGALAERPKKRARARTRWVRAALVAAGLLIASGTVAGVGLLAFRDSSRAALPAPETEDIGRASDRNEPAAATEKPAPAAPTAGEPAVPAPAAARTAAIPQRTGARPGGPAPAIPPRAPIHGRASSPADKPAPAGAPRSTRAVDAPATTDPTPTQPTNPLWKEIEDDNDSDPPRWHELTSEE